MVAMFVIYAYFPHFQHRSSQKGLRHFISTNVRDAYDLASYPEGGVDFVKSTIALTVGIYHFNHIRSKMGPKGCAHFTRTEIPVAFRTIRFSPTSKYALCCYSPPGSIPWLPILSRSACALVEHSFGNARQSISVIHKIWTPESYRTRTSLKGLFFKNNRLFLKLH